MGSSVLKPLLETCNFSSSSLSSASPWPSLATTVITTREEDTATGDTIMGRETLRPSQNPDTMDIITREEDTDTGDTITERETPKLSLSLDTMDIITRAEVTATEDTTMERETLRPSQSLDTMTRDMVTAMDTDIMDECFMLRLWS